jgi:hypothetical protein
MPTDSTRDPDQGQQAFYDLNPAHRFTHGWADPQRTWRWMEAEVTLGDRVQRALAGGENLPLDYHGEDPGDIRDLRADHVATLARYATDPNRRRPEPVLGRATGPARSHHGPER